jgi:hypothetical protein
VIELELPEPEYQDLDLAGLALFRVKTFVAGG